MRSLSIVRFFCSNSCEQIFILKLKFDECRAHSEGMAAAAAASERRRVSELLWGACKVEIVGSLHLLRPLQRPGPGELLIRVCQLRKIRKLPGCDYHFTLGNVVLPNFSRYYSVRFQLEYQISSAVGS
jgi:hypothetical protein